MFTSSNDLSVEHLEERKKKDTNQSITNRIISKWLLIRAEKLRGTGLEDAFKFFLFSFFFYVLVASFYTFF